jgi:protein-S-isoprenylcysteine O-methyltransferase Ste14
LHTFRQKRLYDLLAASPLILFNAFAVASVLLRVGKDVEKPIAKIGLADALSLLSFGAVMTFLILQTVFLIVRKLPQQFSQTLFSQAVALAASNAGMLLLLLPRAPIPTAVQTVSSLIIFLGASASSFVMIWLGRGFSILPQARQFTSRGPYRFVRHPLYLSETITTIGLMLQFVQPWSFLLALAITAIQFPRMRYEERVLRSVYPGYDAYVDRTALFLPGLL